MAGAISKTAFVQYSKKMCTWVTLFWMIYRLVNFVVVLLRPDTANALADLCAGVDTVMIVNMGAYTANSGTEKVAIAYSRRRSLYERQESEGEDAGTGAEEEADG